MPPKKSGDDDAARRKKQQQEQERRIAEQMAAKQAEREEEQKQMAAAAVKQRDEAQVRRQRMEQIARATDQTIEGIVAHVQSLRRSGQAGANAGDGCAGGSRNPITYDPDALGQMRYGGNLDTSFSRELKFRIPDPSGDILIHARPRLKGG